ncbi:MAG: electron transfer flavoprotein subunit alpha/FixB family protein [Oscillospiraceae bacterium]
MNDNFSSAAILVIIQTINNLIHPVSVKVIETARTLGMQGKRDVYGVVLCSCLTLELEAQLKQSGIKEVVVYQHEALDSFIPEIYIDILEKYVTKLKPDVVLASATPEGRTLSSMLAGRLKTGVTADCTDLSFNEDGFLLQTRPAYGGNIMAQIITKTARPQIATLRFGSNQSEVSNTKTKIKRADILNGLKKPFGGYSAQWIDRVDLADCTSSQIIFAIGGGVREKSDIEIFRQLAKNANAKLMCSRVLVERGWFERNCQIGLSGQTVSPKLLVAFGISGSLQFLAGVQEAQRICAVNLDEDAPILKVAHCPIVADINDVTAHLKKIILEELTQ